MSALQRAAWHAAVILGIALVSACSDANGPGAIDRVVITGANGVTSPTVRRGQTLQLQARALSGDDEVQGVQFEWSSETPGIATVDGNGRVSGLEYGTAIIKATPSTAAGVEGRLNVPVVGPPVVTIFVEPIPFVDTNHSIQLQAFAQDLAGATVTGAELTWRSLNETTASVSSTGLVTGLKPGQAVIEVEAWNGVKTSIPIQVTPVTAIAPDTGRYGTVITIEGAGLPANPEVLFTGANPNSPVPAVIRSASASSIEVWVPVGAETGPVEVRSGGTTFQTSRRFTLRAKEDIFHWAASPDPFLGFVTLPFPYYNPALQAVAHVENVNFFHFVVEDDTPFSLHLEDRGDRNAPHWLWARLFRIDPPEESDAIFLQSGIAWLESLDYFEDEVMDEAVFSTANLPAGHYFLVINIVNASAAQAHSRAYGIRLAAQSHFALAPDAYEPNDIPQEAPEIALPFVGQVTRYENTYAFDHYVFELTERSTVEVVLSDDRNFLAFLPEDFDLMVAQHTLPPDLVPPILLSGQVSAVGPAGRYVLAVWDAGGRARDYALEFTTAPAPEDEGEGGEGAAVVSGFELLTPGNAGLEDGRGAVPPRYDWLAPVRAREAALGR